MNNTFTGQVAIVTGAASGLGLAIARKLHADGAQVALLDLNEASLQEVARELGAGSFVFAVDLTNEEQVASVVNQLVRVARPTAVPSPTFAAGYCAGDVAGERGVCAARLRVA